MRAAARLMVGLVGCLLLGTSGCGGSGGGDDVTGAGDVAEVSAADEVADSAVGGDVDDVITLEDAMATPIDDLRPNLMALVGEPQAFRIVFVPTALGVVRHETWDYLELGSRFDFIDGQLVLMADIDHAGDGAWYPGHLSPTDFEEGMDRDEVRAQLAGVELQEVDLAEVTGEGGTALVGGQLLVTFMDDVLASVETFVLEPDAQGDYDELIAAVTP